MINTIFPLPATSVPLTPSSSTQLPDAVSAFTGAPTWQLALIALVRLGY